MIRSEDFRFDPDIDEAAEHATRLNKVVAQLRDRIFVLQAAIDLVDAVGDGLPPPAAGSYKYVRLDLNDFFRGLFLLEGFVMADSDYAHPDLPHRPLSFIDAGCGSGRLINLLRATDRFGFCQVRGIELSDELAARGRKLYGMSERDLIVADAMTFDYAGHDVVFFYRPFKDEALQLKFENHIVESMDKGAYIFAFSALSFDEDIRLARKDFMHGIFKKL